jgi:NAD(P)-dependent dehydrogenase (short-subunit alcohol dehydrogenase family)
VNLENRLADKVVLVTGGGSGLGKGACQRIAAEGGSLAVADIREALAEETASDRPRPWPGCRVRRPGCRSVGRATHGTSTEPPWRS